jgi:5-methylcytosine-specific restriction enzyme A
MLARARNPEQICHICGVRGGDFLDHKVPGDDHSLDNLDWAHDRVPPHCHRTKSSREGAAAKPRLTRKPETHPALK